MAKKFRGALVFQDASDLTNFCQAETLQRLVSLGGFKVLNLYKVGKSRIFKNLGKSNTLFLLALPLLKELHIQALALRAGKTKDQTGLVALWQPMPVVVLVHKPSKMSWGKINRRSTKPCCASVSSLMGLVTLLRTGKETHLDKVSEKEYIEAQRFLKRLDI